MVIPIILSFFATALIAKSWMTFAKSHGIMGIDVHKEEKPSIPEMGGVAIFAGYAIGICAAFSYSGDKRILLSLISVSTMFLIGVIDDRRTLSQKKKFTLSFLAGIPFLFSILDTRIDFLLFSIDFGVVYYLLVFVGIVAASNATNLLAGFNGEEAGCGILASLSLIIASLFLHRDIVPSLLAPIFASLFAFFYFNRYPSRLFCGDCGSLIIGASIASSVIFGKMELLGAIAIAPAIVEFFLKLPIRFSGKIMGATAVRNGILFPPPYLSVANILTSHLRLTERKLVYVIFLFQVFFGLLVVILSIVGA